MHASIKTLMQEVEWNKTSGYIRTFSLKFLLLIPVFFILTSASLPKVCSNYKLTFFCIFDLICVTRTKTNFVKDWSLVLVVPCLEYIKFGRWIVFSYFSKFFSSFYKWFPSRRFPSFWINNSTVNRTFTRKFAVVWNAIRLRFICAKGYAKQSGE